MLDARRRRRVHHGRIQWIRRLEQFLTLFVILILVSTLWMGMTLQNQPSSPMIPLPTKNSNHALVVHHPQAEEEESPIQMNLWQNNSNIPDWMKDYFDWHTQQISKLNENNWQDSKYLILSCNLSFRRCGGVSDRLKPVPLVLLAANRSQRLFFIHWEKPCPLEEFLVPPRGGLQWSVPKWLEPLFQLEEKKSKFIPQARNLIPKSSEFKTSLVLTHLQDAMGGSAQYDAEIGNGTYSHVYHDLFRILFHPSPALKELTDRKMKTANLVPGQYAVAHYRAEYGREVARHPFLRKLSFLRDVAFNSVRCASELQPGAPIYFASDSAFAMENVKQWAHDVNYPVIQFERAEEKPLPLDEMGNETHPIKPSDYYSTFVDLYLAGNGKCVTFGRGGFGRYASLLSYNVSCSRKHIKAFFPERCQGVPPFDKPYEVEPG